MAIFSENLKQEIKKDIQVHLDVITESFRSLCDKVEKLEEDSAQIKKVREALIIPWIKYEVQKALSEEGYNLSSSLEHPLEKKLKYQYCPHCGKKLGGY